MDEWHIGDPVDWGDGFMDAQNWGRSYDDDERDSNKSSSQYSERDGYSKGHGTILWTINLTMRFIILTWPWIWITAMQTTGTERQLSLSI